MIHPPFPPLEQLANNFFLLPALPGILTIHIRVWQDNSRQLSAWIEKAKARCAGIPDGSWFWPISPFAPYPIEDDSSSISEDDGWRPSRRESDKSFIECPRASSKHIAPHICTSFIPSTPARFAHAFGIETQCDSPKRTRKSSPIDSHRDGDEANKKQLVLWQPSVAQLLEQHETLMRGEVLSYSSSRKTDSSQNVPRESLSPITPLTTDPRLPSTPRLRNRAAPTLRVTRSQGLKKL
jgi:hypothetical protein